MNGGGGGGGMNGGGMNGGGMFAGSGFGSAQPATDSPGGGTSHTYQCVTPVGRCAFVAPAALRDNSLRSGADCACPDNRQTRGRIE
jgi:hypothetical protein